MNNQFSFDGALMHFARTRAPGGFLWKFILAYGVLYGAAGAVLWFIVGPGFIRAMNLANEAQGGQLPESAAAEMLSAMGLAYVVAGPVFLVIWSMLEAALQRRYVRLEGFSLGLGADEFRLMGMALLWLLTLFGLYILVALAIALPALALGAMMGGGASGPNVAIILFVIVAVIAAFCLLIWVLVRLSPAAAVTIRDRKVSLFRAWPASKNRFWPLFGAFVLLIVGSAVVGQVIQAMVGLAVGGALMANMEALEAGDLMPVLTSPMVLTALILFIVVYIVLQAVTQFIGSGIGAHAANTDPRIAGQGAADVFS